MIDKIDFETPYGSIGKIANRLFLKAYIERFLLKRNETIKEYAESQKWKAILM